METKIYGSVMPMVEITLDRGKIIYAQTGAMQWMDYDVEMDTKSRGGVFGAIKRSISGESMFLAHFSARREGAKVAFGHSFPGKILEIDVSEKSVICQKRAFLCAEESVELNIAIQKRLGSGIFGGEGFIMQKLSGTGSAFVEMDGEYLVKELATGEKLKLETGALGMYEEGMDMNVEMIKGFSNMFLGGEGLFLTTIEGPGKVWIQTMPAKSLAGELLNFFPKRKDENYGK